MLPPTPRVSLVTGIPDARAFVALLDRVLADLETVLVVHDLLTAIGIERFTIRVNDRQIDRMLAKQQTDEQP